MMIVMMMRHLGERKQDPFGMSQKNLKKVMDLGVVGEVERKLIEGEYCG